MSESLGRLRSELNRAEVGFGINVGATALFGVVAAWGEGVAPRWLTVPVAALTAGNSARIGMRAHTMGQEIAAREAAEKIPV